MKRKISFKDAVVNMELAGARFYRSMKKRVQGGRLKDVLDYLAAAEEEHAGKMKELLSSEPVNRAVEEALEEASGSLVSLVEDPDDLALLAREMTGEDRILRLALSIERDSIGFYTGIVNRLEDPVFIEQFQAVIEEEENHVDELTALISISKRSEEQPAMSSEEMARLLEEARKKDEAGKEE